MSNYENVAPEKAAELIKNGECYVIDVRTEEEYLSHRIPGAYLLPVQEIQQRHGEIPKNPKRKLLFVCEHGIRSVHTCMALSKAGWNNIVNMSGGMAEWLDCKLPYSSGDQRDPQNLGPVS
jgi:rhodanese-related sulfurtransferase